MHVRFTQIFTAAPKDSLLANAVSYAISIVKADRVQGGGTTNRVQKEISISVATNSTFWHV